MRNNIMNANKLRQVRRVVGPWVIGAVLVSTVAVMAGNPAFAADEKKKNTVSKELAKTLKEASDLVNGKKYSEALAKLKDAEANPKKTPYDTHIINELAGVAYAKTNNYPEASKAFEAEINDGFLDEKEIPGRVKIVAQVNYQLKIDIET